MATKTLAAYRLSLDQVSRLRYDGKCQLIGQQDPYVLDKNLWTSDINSWACVTYPDIVNFLINSTSAYSLDQLKSYKGLEAYNQFICGWVRDVAVYKINDLCLHTAKVMHSQRLSDTPLVPWIIIQPDGKILAAHCNCMAGLGEACTHIAALLFSIEASVKVREAKTVTGEKSYWLPPSVKGVSYKKLKDIDFTSAKARKKKLDVSLSGNELLGREVLDPKPVEPPTETEFANFLQSLNASGTKSALLSVCAPYQADFKPKPLNDRFPKILTDFVDRTLLEASFGDILKKCDSPEVTVTCTQEEADAVEAATKDQSASKMWHRFRSGRVTASKMRAVCHSNPSAPSVSLVTSICYSEESTFKTAATSWGCQHEKTALDSYQQTMNGLHDNFTLERSGLLINPDYPFVGATPDGLVSCDCCGTGLVEIKCPYCVRHKSLAEYTGPNSCLEDIGDGQTLKRDHAYYYQVQTQIFVAKAEFCDFVVWTEKDFMIERVEPEESFWTEILSKAEQFHTLAVMPELVGRFFSRLNKPLPLSCNSSATNTITTSQVQLYCYCQREESDSEMVACDNENCKFQWFHLVCLKLKKHMLPQGNWDCPDCRKEKNSRKGKKRKH